MKAWVQHTYGRDVGLLKLERVDLPDLMISGGDRNFGRFPVIVLSHLSSRVKVLAVATNPVDTKKRYGSAEQDGKPMEARLLPGWDFSGTVESVGSSVPSGAFSVGDDVMAAGEITRDGCFAEFVCVDYRIVALKPKSVSHQEAAALPLTAITAYEAITEVARLDTGVGKSVLIISGAGGVGSIAIQLAKKVFLFDVVVATASRDTTIEYCKSLGADHTINHHGDMAQQLKEAGLPGGCDLVLNFSEADGNFDSLAALTAHLGFIVMITGMHKDVNLTQFFTKRVSVGYELMFSRTILADKRQRQGRLLGRIASLVDLGVIEPRAVESQRFAIAQLREASALQQSGKAMGKVTLDCSSWPEVE